MTEIKKSVTSGHLSTGSTLLNLACSGKPGWGLQQGYYYLLVGDSKAGKTWLALQILAEACRNKAFAEHRLIFNSPERGALMDIKKYFGASLADRMNVTASVTIQGFYDHLDGLAAAGKPFIEILDSEDALDDEKELAKASQNRKARSKDGDVKGSYGGVGKAKENSSRLRTVHNRLADTGSILIIIKQTRDNIGFDAMFNPKTRSGGRALTFYATLEFWFSIKERIKKTVRGKVRTVGSLLKIAVKKNRVSGRDCAVEVPFYPSHGFDDTGSLVDYLVEEKHWTKNAGGIQAKEMDFQGPQERLIEWIEENNKEKQLRMIAAEVWADVAKQCEVNRKNRYE